MARLFLTDIDLSGNQLLGHVLEKLAAPPADPGPARLYFDTTLAAARIWTGSAWITLGAASAAGPAPFPPYVQNTPATTWTITHGLGRYPDVVVVDTAGNKIEPGINYPDLNTVVLVFSAPTSGTAELEQR